MRVPLVLLLATTLLLTNGSRHDARAEEEKPAPRAYVVPHMVTLLKPLALSARRWHERKVTVTRASMLDRAWVIGLRAPDEAALQWATKLVTQDEPLQPLLRSGEFQVVPGVLREDGQMFEIDLLLTVAPQELKRSDTKKDLDMTLVFKRSEFQVAMRLTGKEPVRDRTFNGEVYAKHRRSYEPATAYQFLALTFNVMSRHRDSHYAIRAAHWQALPKKPAATNAPVGPSVLGIRAGPKKTIK